MAVPSDAPPRDLASEVEMHTAIALSLIDGDMLAALRAARELNDDGSVPGSTEEYDPMRPGWHILKQVSDAWYRDGCPRFVLSASVASLLVSTKAPAVTDDMLKAPYDVMVVEVPGEWTSMHGVGPLHVLLARAVLDGMPAAIVAASRRFIRPARLTAEEQIARADEDAPDVITRVVVGDSALADDGYAGRYAEVLQRAAPPYFTEAVRYLVNTCCLVIAHNDCAPRREGKNAKATSVVHDVRPPRDVEVTAEFRRHAQGLVANRRIQEKKRALLHIVRGHWKRQPSGIGRSERVLIWVRPYQRGADSLGRIVAKEIAVTDRSMQSTGGGEAG